MDSFWELSDLDKIFLLLKIGVVLFGCLSLLVSSFLITALVVDYVREYRKDKREERRKEIERGYSAPPRISAPYSVGIASPKETRRSRWADETTQFMRTIQEFKK